MSSDTLELVRRVRDALASAGLALDGEPDCSGELAMCGTVKKPHGTDGRYAVHLDWPPNVWLVNYHEGGEGRTVPLWERGQLDAMPESEREALQERIRRGKEENARRLAERRGEAAERANRIFRTLPPAGEENAYLSRKGVRPLGDLRRARDGRLVVPVRNAEGALVSLQFIAEDGSKRFLKDGEKKACFFPIGKDAAKPLLICEGVATGLSLHECLELPVLVAFDAGNLLPVAEVARARYPGRSIILAADNDTKTDGNPGVTKATAAAVAVGGSLAVPRREDRAVDWNDLHQAMGAGEVRTQFMTHKMPEASTSEEGGKEKLPSGFSLRSGGPLPGLWHTEVKEEGDPVETWVGGLLSVLGATRDENGNAWGLLLEWPDDDGNLHTWAMPKAMLAGRDSSAVLARLADEGWRFASGQRARNLFYRFLTEYRTTRRARCVPRTGWHRGVFVFPDAIVQNFAGRAGRAGQAYGHKGFQPSSNDAGLLDMLDNERIVLQVQAAHNPFRMAGSLEGWRSTVGEWARGNSRLMLAVCASLAAPLLEATGQESGGFNWMGQSSTGKTTALVAAASVWGKGTSAGGYVQNWRATANGLEGLAALHSDTALCLDEIGQAPGRTIQEAAYMLANGMGKARASQDGSARAVRSWRCMILSTGEKGLAEKIAEEGGRVQAGQMVRLIDVPADAGAGMGIFEDLHGHESPRVFADALRHAAATDHGHAARFFIGKFLEAPDIAAQLHAALDAGLSILCPAEASGQVQRVARRFLLCAVAGEMATDWGLLPWSNGEALQAVKACFDAWLAVRGGSGAAEDDAIIAQVSLFIEQHGASRFQDADNPDATCINRVGFRRNAGAGTEFYILPESFRAEVCKGVNHRRAASVLLDRGMLLPGDSRSYTRRPSFDLPGFGRKRCYVLFFGGGFDVVA